MDDLIDRIRAGDHAAFAKLVGDEYRRLFDFAFSYTKSTPAAEDVVQEVLLNVWERRESVRPRRGLSAYLFGAVRNRALNHVRSTRSQAPITDDPSPGHTQSMPDAEVELKGLLRDYQAAVVELPDRRREVFQLSRLYGLTYEEIAEVMDISVNTVRTQMSAALEHLRRRLSEYL